MRKLLILFTTIAAMMACSDSETPIIGGEQGENAETPEVTPLKMRKIIVSTSQGDPQRTTLSGTSVLWDEGDQYCIINQDPTNIPSTTLKITLNEPGSGLGVNTISGASSLTTECDLQYSDIKVEIGGENVTNKILSENTGDNNYKVGATNKSEKYQYTLPNKTMEVKLYGSGRTNRTFYIARCSESDNKSNISDSNQAVITISGIQWKFNIGGWNTLNENNANLVNGNDVSSKPLKNVADYHWVHGVNTPLTITSEAGKTHGIFEGQIYQDAVIDETTMAVYPTDAVKTYKDDILTINVPEHQKYVENSFDHKANIMIGNVTVVEEGEYEGKYDAHFTNSMGVLELTLTGDDYYLENITVTNRNKKPLWGTASIAAAEYEKGISTDAISGGSPTVTLDCPGVKLTSTPTTFYIVVPVGAFAGGFDVSVNTQDHRTKTFGASSSQNTIGLNDIKKMPTIKITGLPLVEFDIENAAVKKYMSYGPYSGFENSTRSYFTTYKSTLDDPQYYDKDDPLYYSVNWSDTGAAVYSVTFHDNTAGKDVFTNREVTTISYDFINMIPGHTYTFIVKADDKVIKGGSFKAIGQVRMVTVCDSWNYRDIGGWASTLGGTIKYGWLFRGGSLNGVWTSGKKSKDSQKNVADINKYNVLSTICQRQLRDLNIKGELDLRAVNTNPSSSTLINTEYPHTYSFGQHHTGFTSDWDFMQISSTTGLNNPTSDDAIVRDVSWLIEQVLAGKPMAFHCKSGADRTGGVAMTIEALLGVAPGDIARDYELTNFSKELGVVQQSNSALRDRRIDDTQKEIYTYRTKGFPNFPASQGSNWQEKAYYYLNQTFHDKGTYIPASKLDAFIKFMLGKESYTHPSFAEE